ncbi:MAG: hypothetical protein AAB152_14330 [Candidatus Coatesbacteria bacterium]
MPGTERAVRRSVTLPPRAAERVRTLAQAGHTTASRVLAELIDLGLESKENEKKRFMALADRLAQAKSPASRARLKEELARLTFGD